MSENHRLVKSCIEHKHTSDTYRLDLANVQKGDVIGVNTGNCKELGIEFSKLNENNRIEGKVTRTFGNPAIDIWVTTKSGAQLHIYPKRGKVERVDTPDNPGEDYYGVSTLVNAGLTVPNRIIEE